jgi:hypothetical protein
MSYGVYVARCEPTAFTTAKTVVQIVAPATAILEVTRFTIEQSNLTANAVQGLTIRRKSSAATVTAMTPAPVGAYAAAGSTAGYNASAEGTDSTIIQARSFSWLAGLEWVAATEDDRIIVPPSGILAMVLVGAPAASTTVAASFTYIEKG